MFLAIRSIFDRLCTQFYRMIHILNGNTLKFRFGRKYSLYSRNSSFHAIQTRMIPSKGIRSTQRFEWKARNRFFASSSCLEKPIRSSSVARFSRAREKRRTTTIMRAVLPHKIALLRRFFNAENARRNSSLSICF